VRRRWPVGVVVLLVALSAPALAFGSGAPVQPGVHVDPGSPAAKEYAVPLGSARGASTPNGPGSEKLFGSGITPGAASTPSAGSTAPPASTPVHADSQRHHARKRAHRSERRKVVHSAHKASVKALVPVTVLDSGSSGGAGIVWMLAAAALVLGVGGLGAFVVARRGRRTSPEAG
jgi:hypothetical protein